VSGGGGGSDSGDLDNEEPGNEEPGTGEVPGSGSEESVNEGLPLGPANASTTALSDALDEPVLTDIESGAAQLLSTATPHGLSDPFSSAQGTGFQQVDPYTNVASASGTFNPFVGRDVDSYTNMAVDGANPNGFTGGQNVNWFTGGESTTSNGERTGLLTSPNLLASNGEIQLASYGEIQGNSSGLTLDQVGTLIAGSPPVGTTEVGDQKYGKFLVNIAGVPTYLYYNDRQQSWWIEPIVPSPAATTPLTTNQTAPTASPTGMSPAPALAAPTTAPAVSDWTTQTEWDYPKPDPRLIQPVTNVDTGNRPLNVLVNKVLLPWRNALAFYENIALATLIGTDDALKHSAVQTEYQAAQDMMPLEAAMGLTMEVGPALDYAVTRISTSPRLRGLATDSVFLLMGAFGPQGAELGPGGAEPALQMLGTELQASLPSPPTSTVLIQNSSRGNTFQTATTNIFSLPRNTRTMLGQTNSGALWPTIPDVYAGGQAPIADIKDVVKLSFTRQLQAQADVAKSTGTSFNIITGPRNQIIYQPLADAVQASGGFIFRTDPSAMTVEVWDFANRVWVPFLGGS
jgi:hypothetical protein